MVPGTFGGEEVGVLKTAKQNNTRQNSIAGSNSANSYQLQGQDKMTLDSRKQSMAEPDANHSFNPSNFGKV